MSYHLELTVEALSELNQLTSTIQQRIIKKLNWLVENFDHITPIKLTANLSNFFILAQARCLLHRNLPAPFFLIIHSSIGLFN